MNLDPLQSIHRLGIDGYQRPKKTLTDTLQTQNAIEEKLNGYIEVDDNEVNNIQPGSFIRYIKWDLSTNKERFIMGGILMRVLPEYLILKGKDNGTFSAQRYTYDKKGNRVHVTRFFKMLSNEDKLRNKLLEMQRKANEIIGELEDTIDKQAQEIEELKEMIRKLKKQR